MRVLAVVPAYRAARTVARVVEGLRAGLGPESEPVIVVDDGSDDDTALEAERAGALVLRHDRNRGKGAALRTGFERALSEGAVAVVSVDADGQHPSEEAVRVARHEAPREALVIGVRDLRRDGAPLPNRFSNAFSNLFLSWFGGRRLADTQCGLRRYPLPEIFERGSPANGYAYEADVLLRAARRDAAIVELPVRVVYPKGSERVTHFHPLRDPARITARVLLTTLLVPRRNPWARALGLALRILAAGALLLFLLHVSIGRLARLEPLPVTRPPTAVVRMGPSLSRFGDAYVLRRGALLEVGLRGTPEAIGFAHSALLRHDMLENEGILLARFGNAVPGRVARTLLLDLARYRYRAVDREMSAERLTEIAAGAAGFAPDPYADFLPTYQRFVYLNALYDIALSFERSPLVGCTTVAFHGAPRPGGGVLLARAFDMEIDAVFDRKKAVFLVASPGAIPFASVAWPGLVGVVSGMNAEGLAVVVHGARAGEPRAQGEPVVHALRRVLEHARTVEEATRLLAERTPLVSHLVVIADARGSVAAVERVPGAAASVHALSDRAAITNHFEGAARDDEKNRRVLRETSSRARRQRADELVARFPSPVGPEQALSALRDRSGVGDTPLPLGDRRAIDAMIATHGVIFDTASRTLWVSEAPHLLGRFVAFDLRRMLDPAYVPSEAVLPTLPADPLVTRVVPP